MTFGPLIIALVLAGAVVLLLLAVTWRGQAGQKDMAARLFQAHAELTGRLAHMAETQAGAQAHLSERMQNQERAMAKVLEERLGDVRKHVGDNLQELRERLAVIDTAQQNITQLSGQMVQLQDILSNKQARGAFGEVQLENLVRNALPPSAYTFQATLSNAKRADCLLILPNPPGPIVIDAKFPLEGYKALQAAKDDATRLQAGREFSAGVLKHVKDIAERYIIPGETAESALLFLPAEAVYAELHANFGNVVEESYRRRVWIVSPTTLMATLNTVRAVLKDARMREMAGVIQTEVLKLLEDVARIDERAVALTKHFDLAAEDIRKIRISSEKVTRRAGRIEELQVGEAEQGPAGDLEPPTLPSDVGN
ncbi:MAG: recombinase RmuC [Alphaproteobacteria bacterium RIFOXYD12_FULL_60_8]|nr:MAG: recombinase RmuC [Alphaproteobacteria bacterium RIFOXYD12_FULL_60_8]